MADLLDVRELAPLLASAREKLDSEEDDLIYLKLPEGDYTALDVPVLSAFLERGADDDALLNELIGFEMFFKSVNENRPKFRSLTPLELAQEFVRKWFEQLHKLVCDDKEMARVATASGVGGGAIAAALAHSVVKWAEVSDTVALAAVTATLLVLAKITRGAFCSMSKEEILEAIEKRKKSSQAS